MPSVTYYEKDVSIYSRGNFATITTSTEDLERLIEDTFPENAELMKEIAKAESGMKPTAYNPEMHNGCQGSIGLFQIACVNYEGDPDDLFDPIVNLKIARQVYDSQGLFAWGTCNKKIKCN